jgi:hypothetical protein
MATIKDFTKRNTGKVFVQFEEGGEVLSLGNAVTIAPFVETGTLRPFVRTRFPKLPLEFTIEVKVRTYNYDAGLKRFLQRREKMERASRRKLWPRWAALFTLIVAGVAICL